MRTYEEISVSKDFTFSNHGTYTPLELSVTLRDVRSVSLRLHEDHSVSIDWKAIEAYAAISPVTWDEASKNDFTARCVAHALLAVRDGRVTEIA